MKDIFKNQKTIVIASLDENNFPQASYAPYVMVEDRIYIYISQVADHYRYLEMNSKVGLMIIEDESISKNLFGRKRIRFQGDAKKVLEVSEDIKKEFETIHGSDMMHVLYKMDFDFFEIKISSGTLVEGFGKAYKLTYVNNEWDREHIVIDKSHDRK